MVKSLTETLNETVNKIKKKIKNACSSLKTRRFHKNTKLSVSILNNVKGEAKVYFSDDYLIFHGTMMKKITVDDIPTIFLKITPRV